jgi:hypothetical protein
MTPEMVSRVDAWIDAHARAMARDPAPLAFELRYAWLDARKRWQSYVASGQGDAARRAAEAAMRGLLLALVRWAWHDKASTQYQDVGGLWACIVPATWGSPFHMFEAKTEDEALVDALESAPRRTA